MESPEFVLAVPHAQSRTCFHEHIVTEPRRWQSCQQSTTLMTLAAVSSFLVTFSGCMHVASDVSRAVLVCKRSSQLMAGLLAGLQCLAHARFFVVGRLIALMAPLKMACIQ